MPVWAASPTEANIPWYTDTTLNQVHSPTICHFTSPYLCTLRINVPSGEAHRLKRLYSPLLQGIDPAFQLVQIREDRNNRGTDRSHMAWQDSTPPIMGLATQSLSIVMFLRDDAHSQLRAAVAKGYLESPPWEFHHKIELTSRTDLRTVARQEFYECAPRHHFPLWSICSIHCGNEQLRFNIFVKDFERMKEFYSVIIGKKVCACKPGFCSFRLYSQPGLEIQLSLKYSPCLISEPTVLSHLCFRVRDVSRLRKALPNDIKPLEDGTWCTRDVDGNAVVLMEDDSLDFDHELLV